MKVVDWTSKEEPEIATTKRALLREKDSTILQKKPFAQRKAPLKYLKQTLMHTLFSRGCFEKVKMIAKPVHDEAKEQVSFLVAKKTNHVLQMANVQR